MPEGAIVDVVRAAMELAGAPARPIPSSRAWRHPQRPRRGRHGGTPSPAVAAAAQRLLDAARTYEGESFERAALLRVAGYHTSKNRTARDAFR